VLALVEGRVADLAKALEVARERSDITPIHCIRVAPEVVGTQRSQASQECIDSRLAGDEGGKRLAVVHGFAHRIPPFG
jgi:hypothetical protein